MIDNSKTVSEYTDDEIKSLRSIFKEHCSGSPREFTVYKVFIQGVKEMRGEITEFAYPRRTGLRQRERWEFPHPGRRDGILREDGDGYLRHGRSERRI